MWSKNIPQEIFFFKNYAENEAGKLVPVHFLFFKKALYQVKPSVLQLDFAAFRQPSDQHTIETNCLKLNTTDLEIFLILIYQIKVWEQFLYDLSAKMFVMLYSINYQISLSACLNFLRYRPICVLQLFVNQVVTSYISKLT